MERHAVLLRVDFVRRTVVQKVARIGGQNTLQVCTKTQATVSMSSERGCGQTDKGTELALSLPLHRLYG